MKNLIRLCCQMSLKLTKLINVFMWKTYIKVMSLYVSILILGSNDYVIKSTKKILASLTWMPWML